MKDELKREIRREAAYERLQTRNPKCRDCSESDWQTLQGFYPDIICYECSSMQAGRSWTEDHHPAGRHNSLVTVTVSGNDHRMLNDMQRDWPQSTLRNPNGSPLLAAAAAIRGWLDVLRLIVERTVGYIPAFLEDLDRRLQATLGDRWWEELGLKGTAP